jgi:O-antigen ligase
MPAILDADPPQTVAPRFADRLTLAAAWMVTAAVLFVPLICAPDLIDRYRLVKESWTRGEALLGFVLVFAAIVFGGRERLQAMLRDRLLSGVVLAGFVWAAITTATSTQRALSIDSMVTVGTTCLLFLVTWFVAPQVRLVLFDLLVPAVGLNVTLAALQEYGIYNPFKVHEFISRHLTATGFIGNPNIVGSYAALVTVILVAAAFRVHGFRRVWYLLGAVAGVVGVLVSDTETAVIVMGVGLLALAVGKSMKRVLVVTGVLLVVLVAGIVFRVPVVREIVSLPQRIQQGGLETALSGRVAPALIALKMTRERPLFGFGPGTYGFHFMPRRIALTGERKGSSPGIATNFGEVHNDHLQILAEAGVPAYLLFLAFILLILRIAWRSDAVTERAQIARIVALPLALAFLVLCLAQFPLHVAVARQLLVTIAGLIAGWSRG